MNIILIGMPACGKSCMGRAISKRTRMRLLDTDRLIEEKECTLKYLAEQKQFELEYAKSVYDFKCETCKLKEICNN